MLCIIKSLSGGYTVAQYEMNELLSALIDGAEIEPAEKAALLQRLESDPALRAEYLSLKACKDTLHKRQGSLRDATPPEVRHNILAQIRNQARTEMQAQQYANPLQRLFDLLAQYRFATAGAVLAILVIAVSFLVDRPNLSTSPPQVSSASMNFVSGAFASYSKFLEDQNDLKLQTESFPELQDYFRREGVTYQVVQLPKYLKLVGGFVTEMEGKKIGHLVYRDTANEYVYCCQAPKCLFESRCLVLESERMKRLADGKWHCRSYKPKAYLSMKQDETTICAVFASNTLSALD